MTDKDYWGKDKIKHFIVCLIISIISPQASVGAAFAKEYGDYNAQGNHWCWWDIAWDTLGIIVGTLIHIFIVKMISA